VQDHDGIFAGEQEILFMATEALEELQGEVHGVCWGATHPPPLLSTLSSLPRGHGSVFLFLCLCIELQARGLLGKGLAYIREFLR
jgi:hypothetical protein